MLEIRQADDLAPAIDTLRDRAEALYVPSNPLANTNRVLINDLALSARMPTVHGFRQYVDTGGLISYGPSTPDLFRRAAEYVDKILRGAKPGDLPVEQPTPTGEPRDSRGRFKSGNIGGPGRPPGSRNALGEAFVADVYEDWTKHGEAVLAQVRIDNPGAYLRVIASLVPRDVIIQRTPNEFDNLSDAELVELVQEEARALLEGSPSEEQ